MTPRVLNTQQVLRWELAKAKREKDYTRAEALDNLIKMLGLPALDLPRPKRRNITQWLNKHKGGNWKYDGIATWWCDDKVRHMSRAGMDFSRDDGGGPAGYHLYGGNSPGWVHFTDEGE